MALISVEEAHTRLMRLFAPLGPETVPLAEAAGRVLAQDVVATRDQPPFAASAMDGYAVRGADTAEGNGLTVIGVSTAGARFDGRVGPGQAVRIFTGAPVPEGADYIVIQEDADRDGDTVTVRAGRGDDPFIRPAGSDFVRGARVAAPRRLKPADLALLAAMGAARVAVSRRPEIALIPTGDELVMPGEAPGPDQILSSNTFGLKALLEAEGGVVRLLPIARDTPESLSAALGLAAGADLIVTIGGASVGDFDLVHETATARGLALDFHRIAMRPGKPLMAGRIDGAALVGLPGNPVSAMVCAHIFLRPAIARLLGLPGDPPATLSARLGRALAPNGPRTHFMRARVDPAPGGWICTAFERQDSGLITVLAEANALLRRPPADPARGEGDEVEFIWL